MLYADGGTELKGREVPLDWLELIYDGKPFPEGFGLYGIAPQGDDIFTIDDTIFRWGPLVLPKEHGAVMHGMTLWLFGFRLNLLGPGPQPEAIEAMAGLFYRPEGYILDGSGTQVTFAWGDGPRSGKIGVRFVRCI
jgi:hypothetical protein